MPTSHLAQLNVGRLLAPTDSPIVAEFMQNLEHVNALADAAPGFVWRLQTEQGDATSIKVSDDELFIINLSTWDSMEDLHSFTYRSDHARFVGQRKRWFEPPTGPYMVLWWVEAGHIPSAGEAMERLEALRRDGPGAAAFTFKVPFPPPGAP